MGSSGKSGGTSSPLTTKGDVWGFSTVDARIPVGANTQVLTADSTQALGLKWAAAPGVSWPLTNSADETFQPNSVATNTLTLHNNASAVNGVTITGTVANSGPTINATGSDTNIDLNLNSKATGQIKIATGGTGAGITITNSGPTTLFQGTSSSTIFKDVAGLTILTVTGSSAPTNGLTITSSNTGFAVTMAVTGGDTNQGFAIDAKGTGATTLNATATGSVTIAGGTNPALTCTQVASQTNGVTIAGKATTVAPTITATGSDTNIGLTITTKGTGLLTLTSNAKNLTLSSTGLLTVPGNIVTPNNTLIGPASGSTSISLLGSPVNLQDASGSANTLVATGNSSNVNYINVTGALTTVAPSVAAAGTDTNIDLILNSKGTGLVNIGPASASVALGGGAAPTFGTIGGSGPATAGQNAWLAVKINGTASYIPFWR